MILLCILSVQAVFGEESPQSKIVSYRASDSFVYGDPHKVSFNVTLTLEFEVNYTYWLDGEFPGQAVFNIGITPYSGALAAEYFITEPEMPGVAGNKTFALPQNGGELLGDFSPMTLQIENTYTIETAVRGRLLASLKVNAIESARWEWLEWTQKTWNMTASATVDLYLATEYETFFDMNFSMPGLNVAENSTNKVSGDPAQFLVPEFPSMFIVLPLMTAVLIALVVYRRKCARPI